MAKEIFLIVAILALASVGLVLAVMVRNYLKFRGTRLISCPETKEPAAVEVDAKHAAIGASFGERKLRLTECSRWPERQDCGQECLKQIESAPEDCLVRTIATRWYQGKSCALCGKPFGGIHWSDHKPALIDSKRNTVQWNEVRPEKLPEMLSTHLPVCWNCHIVEWFRRRYPELVTERPSNAAQVRHKTS